MGFRNNTLRCFLGSIAGLSSCLPTVLTGGIDPATWAFPLFQARGHDDMFMREMFELWVSL